MQPGYLIKMKAVPMVISYPNCQLWIYLAGFSFGFYSQPEELLILKWNSSISIMGDRCNPSHHRLEKGSTMQKKRGPWDHFAEDNIITLPIEPNIRPSGNQSLWFGDKYLSIVRLFGHDAPKESGALVLRDSSHPPTSPQSPFDRRTVNNPRVCSCHQTISVRASILFFFFS